MRRAVPTTLRRFLGAGVAVAAATALLAPAAGATGWPAAEAVSPAEELVTAPQLAVGADGARTVLWQRREPQSGAALGYAVRASPPGGGLGPEQLLDTRSGGAVLAGGTDGSAVVAAPTEDGLRVFARRPVQTTLSEVSPVRLAAGPSGLAAVVVRGDAYIAVADATVAGDVRTSRVELFRLQAGGTTLTRVPGAGPGGTVAQVAYTCCSGPASYFRDVTLAADGDRLLLGFELQADAAQGGAASTAVQAAVASIDGQAVAAPTTIGTRAWTTRFASSAGVSAAAGGGHAYVGWLADEDHVAVDDLATGEPALRVQAPGVAEARLAAGPDGRLTVATTAYRGAAPSVGVSSAAAGAPVPPVERVTAPGAFRTIAGFAAGADGTVALLDDVEAHGFPGLVAVQATVLDPPGTPSGPLERVSGDRDRRSISEGTVDAAAVAPDGTVHAAFVASDGTADRIMLAERDAAAPLFAALTVPERVAPGAAAVFSAQATDRRSAVDISWDFGDGSLGTGPLVQHRYAIPGRYDVTASATDASGNRSTQTRALSVGGDAAAGGGPAAPDRRAPVLSALRLTHARFRVGASSTATVARRATRKPTPSGTTLSLRVDERALVVVSFSGTVAGHRSGGRCRPGPATRRGASACRASVLAPALVRTGRGPGAVSIPFSGTAGGHRLAPGTYTASVVAIDAAGNRSRPATVRFTVLSR